MQQSRGHRVTSVALGLLGLLGGAASVRAAPKAPATPPVVKISKAALDKLRSADGTEFKAGLDEARLSGKGALAAGPLIVDLLSKGLPSGLTENALDTLADIEWEGASPTVSWYARDRNPQLRRAAIKALVKTKGPAAVKALRVALSDDDPRVRGLAATGLGALRAKDAVADLFLALDHKVNEAAVSIGQLCAPAECETLEARLGRMPFDVVTSGLDQILFRPAADVSDEAKIKLVGRVQELGTSEASKYLKDVQGRWPATWSVRVKGAIDRGVQATAGSTRGGQ